MSTRVLVTGASGFIGRPAVAALRSRGFDVHAVSSRQAAGAGDGVTWHRADLLDPEAAALVVRRVQATHLLHLAWDVRPGTWAAAGAHLAWLRAGLHLFERFAEAGGARVVTAGTCAEYDWAAGVCSEASTALEPATLYGTTKLALGRVLQAYARETGLTSASARIFFTFGPGEHPNRLVASVIRSLLAGEPADCTDGRQVRDFLYVDDVAGALVAILESPIDGAVNVGSGQPLSVADLARRVGDLLKRPDLVRLGARAAVAAEPPLVVADVARLTHDVGWTPHHDLDSALEATIQWWRERCAREVTVDD